MSLLNTRMSPLSSIFTSEFVSFESEVAVENPDTQVSANIISENVGSC